MFPKAGPVGLSCGHLGQVQFLGFSASTEWLLGFTGSKPRLSLSVAESGQNSAFRHVGIEGSSASREMSPVLATEFGAGHSHPKVGDGASHGALCLGCVMSMQAKGSWSRWGVTTINTELQMTAAS